jgi:hypothetical protein
VGVGAFVGSEAFVGSGAAVGAGVGSGAETPVPTQAVSSEAITITRHNVMIFLLSLFIFKHLLSLIVLL